MKEVFTGMDSDKIECKSLNGVYCDIANLLGVDAAMVLHSSFRGQQINFPVNFFTNEFIADKIVSEYDGHNTKQLATKYCYSEKWIRKIIKNQK